MSKQLQFQITEEDARQRLDVFLAARIGELSRIRIANLLAADACSVNQQPRRGGYHLVSGDFVEFTFDEDAAPTAMTPENITLEVLHEDEHIIVVVKPTGILVHPTRNTKSGTLVNALAYHLNNLPLERQAATGEVSASANFWQADPPDHQEAVKNPPSAIGNLQSQRVVRPGLVHRLDRATSGVMVVAKTQKALSTLTKHFHKRIVKKLYLAVVEGQVQEDSGSIIAPIGQDESLRPQRRIMEDGKYAETKFRVVERRDGATLLELEPVTGRTNQLRIHCAYINHPIVGDEMYGSESAHWMPSAELQTVESGRQTSDFPRLCLHAARLEFHHPEGGKWMGFASPLPEEIERIWNGFAEK
jgi:23S rRNA pseudouridine1911/1915/1917 synthase